MMNAKEMCKMTKEVLKKEAEVRMAEMTAMAERIVENEIKPCAEAGLFNATVAIPTNAVEVRTLLLEAGYEMSHQFTESKKDFYLVCWKF